ncbi:MAG: Lrp/AsnC family transcriptional regulator [Candidatus Methanomethylophilaceae archaeon]|nr:Lrp/AsnC family transcriptional regulator [Thermoplasmata archaeon]MBQ2762934.1 Lrp/AsnC family transcriptional regulator [Candidatus Methanomethylophilaceae archaeon]
MSDFLDTKDVEILKALRKDSRTPMGEIGDSVKTSKATVSRRISKMEEDSVITGYSLETDPSKLGVMKSLIQMQIIGTPVSVVIEQLRAYPEIAVIYKSFGDHNIICEAYTRNVDELYEMIQTKLLKMPSVRNVEVDVLIEKMPININSDLDIYLSNFGKYVVK